MTRRPACVCRKLVVWLLLLAMALAQPALAHSPPTRTLLYGAWVPDETGLLGPSGVSAETRKSFDLRLLDRIGDRAEIGLVLLAMERKDIEAALEEGRIDFALPEVSASVSDKTVLSVPYHRRADTLFMANSAPRLNATGPAAIREALERGLRIGITRAVRHGPEVMALLDDPRFSAQVRRATRASENLDAVIAGTLDGFLTVRIAGLEAIASRPNALRQITYLPDPIEHHDVHIRFSASRVDAATIAHLNNTIQAVIQDGERDHLLSHATAPVLLRLAAATRWFNAIELGGIVAFALSGVLIARREDYSLLGAFVLALLPALGGGIVRDLLVGRSPIGILESPVPLMLVIGTVLGCFVLFRVAPWFGLDMDRVRAWDRGQTSAGRVASFRNLFELTDALGLAALSVIGVAVAIRFWAEPLWLWGPLCAGLTGAGGGILRDVLRGDSRNPALRTSFYAEICILWGLGLSLVVEGLARLEQPHLLTSVVLLTVLGGFVTRVSVVYFRLNSPKI